ncbi:capsule assembly Wzi family protein [Belliella kenyensis]|uniref:Capsule assembly Wzi family protein n=1 Tax=Belliella kenyensis TaxID=1472724 RepID=A0ABV8EFX9_9BACT|nr:capsule assembly Wzi family protein [Belliella kenyensis]MCH7401718.1 capsule assembly Wzi family protein [Belliella kenyensis]MDN3604218.1 capsule assembly Wzi family protein [Belliella kenyensis]
MNIVIRFFGLFLGLLGLLSNTFAQSLSSGQPILEEYLRRNQIANESAVAGSFSLRPVINDYRNLFQEEQDSLKKIMDFGLMPITSISRYNTNRPYGHGDYGMIPSNGLQQYVSAGFFAKFSVLHLQFQPELIYAQNAAFDGFSSDFSNSVNQARFFFWNFGDGPERFGTEAYSRFYWGQSSISLKFKSLELGASTKNIWWGPGQWNALTFSNSAPGFPHLTFNTYKPIQTFLGNFEFQLLVGRLEDSGIAPSQFDELNGRYFQNFSGDWKYLNAVMFSYAPKWVPGFTIGLTRTFQRYSENPFNSLRDYLPVFEGLQKVNFFDNGNTVDYDRDGYDQQLTIFTRYFNKEAKAEIYFEYGRRDHAFNWRELILNPEHTRAYILGFGKLFDLANSDKMLQVRGEMTHQQASVNRYIRYGLLGGTTWHMHHQARGFTNYGQALGVGIGTGSNIQTLEFSLVEKFNKMGLLFERLENHQDFYYRAFGQQKEHQPWVDLSIGLLYDKRWNNLLLSSKLQLINGINYQWQLAPESTPEFPRGENLFSIHSQVSLIYLLGKQP